MSYPDQRFAEQLARQLNKDGPKSVFKTRRSLKRQLLDHVEKSYELEHRQSILREVATFHRQLETVEQFIQEHQLTE